MNVLEGSSKPSSRHWIWLTVLPAAIAFGLLFRNIVFDFWYQMGLSVALLCVLAFLVGGRSMRQRVLGSITARRMAVAVIGGCLSAAVLYGVFFVANAAAVRLFTHGGEQIGAVYSLADKQAYLKTVLLLGLVVAPGEEIFWRVFLQEELVKRYGVAAGIICSVAAYTAVHLPSGNLMLIAAAFVCGVFWALLYQVVRSPWMNVISHAVWGLSIFAIWPLG